MKRGQLIAVVAGATALVAVIGVSAWVALAPSGATAAAHDYLDALAAGDADAAVALLSCEGTDPDALRGAAAGIRESLSNPGVVHVSEDGNRAEAQIEYDLGDSRASATVDLTQSAAGWSVGCGGLGSLTITTSLGDAVAVGTQILPAGAPLSLLPGRYEATAAPVGILEGSGTATVGVGHSADLTVSARASAAAQGIAADEIRSYLDACAAVTDAVPPRCGIRIPWAADLAALEAIAFRVEAHPTLTLTDDLSSFAATGGVLVATATGTTYDGSTADVTYRTEDWSVRGGLTLTGNRLVLSVD